MIEMWNNRMYEMSANNNETKWRRRNNVDNEINNEIKW